MVSESHSFAFSRFAPRFGAYATPRIALYAATLCALTFLPRKARREPMLVFVFEESLFAFDIETPPPGFA